MAVHQYTYVFAIGTIFSLLDAFNNGANDVANAWATSVSSRSVSYRTAMVLATIFEILGACTVGSRTAETIKDGIIPVEAFKGNSGVQMLAFTCAVTAASSWVMWCTRNSTHVSSTYSLISAVAGVGVATAGASAVQWGWHEGGGLATICTLSIVYKGSPNLELDEKPGWYVASVSLGTGGGVCLLSAIFFVPFLRARVIKKDYTVKWYMAVMGPMLFSRPAPPDAEQAKVPNYAVIQEDQEHISSPQLSGEENMKEDNKDIAVTEVQCPQSTYQKLMAEGEQRFHAKLRQSRGPLGWAMRVLHDNPMGAGEIYEFHNIAILFKRVPAMIVAGALYGMHYDIHAAQSGVSGTPEAARMQRVYSHAKKYPNEVEYGYSFIQIITACTASFAHGANDVGNSVGPWAAIYSSWKTGDVTAAEAPVPVWQLAVVAVTICVGFTLYGYNIMKVMGNKITYHSPSRGCSMELGAALTVLIFSHYSLPVSTSMCITGATVGVGLCNGTFKAVNFQRVALLFTAWVLTIPIAGTLGGCLMGLVLNAPHFL
ncbi:hypothetical protein SI65_02377 [Aspergillus cristatus]|uniref:Phosphate transporter n=1 Tax=Aspergillus cristatus TaxID=573508 RepID=A0A1E3BKL7_ASPCR|nr:hypothetical protein SI65_02377 [Aspergillus cristatus]